MKTCKRSISWLLMAVMVLSMVIGYLPAVSFATEDENVLYSQDFSNGADASLQDYLKVENGAAMNTTGNMFELPLSGLVESNNYEVSFKLKLVEASNVYVHMIGLDATNAGNIYLDVIAQGTYIRLSDFVGHDVYNNSGDLHGGLDWSPVNLEDFAEFRFVHYEGYVELWVNGTRRIVSHLSDFGNNNYCVNGRGELTEGTITGIGIHVANPNAAVFDDIKVIEAKPAATAYTEFNAGVGDKIFPLSAQNLYLENFEVVGTFDVTSDAASGWAALKLLGLNSALFTQNGREYAVNFQTEAKGTAVNPAIYAQLEGENPWSGKHGEDVAITAGSTMTLCVQVYGQNIKFFVNGALSVQTTFEELGITKGHLQYIKIQNANGITWKSFSYRGFEGESGASVTASAAAIKDTESVSFTGSAFGTAEGPFKWYVNGVEQAEAGATLVLDKPASGTYTVQYKSATAESNIVTVEVLGKQLTLTADKTEMYPNEAATITADIFGDFAGQALKWYVNGEAQAETGTVLTLDKLASGSYEIVYKCDEVTSNTIILTVLESKIELTTGKNSYFINETAEFTYNKIAVDEAASVEWFVNGEKYAAEGQLALPLNGFEAGSKIVIYCESAGVKSNEVEISVAYDVLATIRGDENHQEIWTDSIEEGKTYGNFIIGSDENGNYLYSDKDGGLNYNPADITMPTSVSYVFTYKIFIPEDIAGKYYVYPTLCGINSKYPTGWVEMAFEVNDEHVRPYIKDQSANKVYEAADYGFGKDLSYEAGIAKKGQWNEIAVAIQGKYVSMYINSEIVLFYELITATVPSGFGMNMWPDAGGNIPIRVKDIAFTGVIEPAPDLQSVTLSTSAVKANVGQSVSVTASLNPFNAEAKEIAWYVNGTKVEGTGLSYTFTADKAGEYKIHVEIDGIKSGEKTITVTEKDAGGNDNQGSTGNEEPADNTVLYIIIAVVAVAAVAVVVVIIIKKKR